MKVALTDDLDVCHALRRAVFIDEQAVPEAEEYDGRDAQALHLLAWAGARPVATARLFVDGQTAHIGRVCVLREMRGAGVGRLIMEHALNILAERGVTTALLSSQTHAIGFYERLGFAAFGPQYMDAGIPHRDMVAKLTTGACA